MVLIDEEISTPGPHDNNSAQLTSSSLVNDNSTMTKAKDSLSEGASSKNPVSSIVCTMEPYTTSQQRGRKKGKSVKSNSNNNTNNRIIPESGVNFQKYLIVDIDDDNVDIFAVYRDIVKCCGRKPKISPQNNRKILICTESKEESEKLMNLNVIGGSSVECKPHFSLNHSKGIIYAPQLLEYTIEKLEEELKADGVVKVERMMKKIEGVLVPQAGHILTFASVKLPDVVSPAWWTYKVKQFIPRPRRCFYCQEFGHVLASCRRKQQGKDSVCVNCGKKEHGPCQNQFNCIHCGGNHPSSSKKCDVYIMEQEIQAVRVMERISFTEARTKVMNKFIRPGVSFSNVVANRKILKKSRQESKIIYPTPSNNNQIVDGPNVNTNKRSLSNESILGEPPSKLQIYKDDVPASPLPDLNASLVKENKAIESNEELAPGKVSDIINLQEVEDATASLEVIPAYAGVLTTSVVEPDPSGSQASVEATDTAVSNPGILELGNTVVEVHNPPKPMKNTGKQYGNKNKPKTKQNNISNIPKPKPQRILQRNPHLEGSKNK